MTNSIVSKDGQVFFNGKEIESPVHDESKTIMFNGRLEYFEDVFDIYPTKDIQRAILAAFEARKCL